LLGLASQMQIGLNRGIAGVIVGGQALSLVLTLLATPVIYSLFDGAAERWRRFRRRSSARGARVPRIGRR